MVCAEGDIARHQDGDCDGDTEYCSAVVACVKELLRVHSALRGTQWHCSLQITPHFVFISASFSNLNFLHAVYYFSCMLIFHIQLFFCHKFHVLFKVCKSVHFHTFQINQPTRYNNFSSLLLDAYSYVQLNMFRASSRPSSGAQQLQ